MSDGLKIQLDNTDFFARAIAQLKKGPDDSVWKEVGDITAEAMGTFAPEDTGALKRGYRAYVGKNRVTVIWGVKNPSKKYAHYQWEGIAMEPVYPVFKGNSLYTDVWRTPKGVKKKYASDMHHIGKPHYVVYSKGKNAGKVAYVKGYTTAGSTHHWTEKARKTSWVYNPMRRKIMEVLKVAIGESIPGARYHV